MLKNFLLIIKALFNVFKQKLKDLSFSVMLILIIVLLINFFVVKIETRALIEFIIAGFFFVAGLTLFLTGVELAIIPVGNISGILLTKNNKLVIVIIAVFILGFFISFAEPSLYILSKQIESISNGDISSMLILIVVSVGVAVLMVSGFVRILYNISIVNILLLSYFIVLILGFFTPPEFLAIAFDTSGATTGMLAVPFILALSIGVSSLKKQRENSENDSFGLVGITSVGPIIFIMLLSVLSPAQEFSPDLDISSFNTDSIIETFTNLIPSVFKDSLMAFSPLFVIFIIMSFLHESLERYEKKRILFGFLYSFIGVFLFLIGVNGGFLQIGSIVGVKLMKFNSNVLLIITGFVIGFITMIAEPAVYILTHQIENVTTGTIKRKVILFALSTGVGIAIALSVLRILYIQIELWHFLLPGYIIALLLTFFVPKIFVGIAFDAGGVATGPVTTTFVLAFIHGIAHTNPQANLLIHGFGMIAMVALMPIITIQLMGFLYNLKINKKGEPEIESH